MSSWHSYPSTYNMGHKAIADLLNHEVNVEEKVDGSQFSFGLIESTDETKVIHGYEIDGDNRMWELKLRSKGAIMHPDAPMDMFKAGVVHVKSIQHLLHPGWTYRGEYLAKPKHNALAYDRIPKGHVIIFDINDGEESYLSYEEKVAESNRIGLEVVPRLFRGTINSVEEFRRFLESTSILGGQQIEGVVVKPVGYDLFGTDKKVLFGKFVSEAYREVHSKSWREANPTRGDIVERLISGLSTPARYAKAVQHLRERGELSESVRDIGNILKEVQVDIAKEEKDLIAHTLYRHFIKDILRGASRGVPDWWKQRLLEAQFERATNKFNEAAIESAIKEMEDEGGPINS